MSLIPEKYIVMFNAKFNTKVLSDGDKSSVVGGGAEEDFFASKAQHNSLIGKIIKTETFLVPVTISEKFRIKAAGNELSM